MGSVLAKGKKPQNELCGEKAPPSLALKRVIKETYFLPLEQLAGKEGGN